MESTINKDKAPTMDEVRAAIDVLLRDQRSQKRLSTREKHARYGEGYVLMFDNSILGGNVHPEIAEAGGVELHAVFNCSQELKAACLQAMFEETGARVQDS